VLCSLILGLAIGFSPPAIAKKPTKEETDKAANLFQAAEAFFNIEEYQKALDAYTEAHQLSQFPDLLFNMAQCHRALGNYKEAANTYKAYLAAVPKSPIRRDVEKWIQEVEAKAAQAPQKKPEPVIEVPPQTQSTNTAGPLTPQPPVDEPTKEPGVRLALPLGLALAGAASAGGAFAVKATIANDGINNSLRQTGRLAMAVTADVSLILSGVTLITAVRKSKKERETPSATNPKITQNGAP
jgi:tetratricopeptide (TPR) repeat protein